METKIGKQLIWYLACGANELDGCSASCKLRAGLLFVFLRVAFLLLKSLGSVSGRHDLLETSNISDLK
jgi:hypothetical protein